MSTTGPVRARNEDHLGWGTVGFSNGRAMLVGSRGEVESAPLFVALDNVRPDAWGPVGSLSDDVPGRGLVFSVADGLGAYGGGDVASEIAVRELLDHLAAHAGRGPRTASLLRDGFIAANQRVFDAALSGQGTRKMQTTLTALVIEPGEVHIGHVGDSRLYRLRGDTLELLTVDHTQVMEMLRMRLISPDQANDHPARYALNRSLGAELNFRTDIRKEELRDADAFLLCSDGLWSKVEAGEIADALQGDLEAGCRMLIGLAVDRGGDDNAATLAIRVRSAGTAAEHPRGFLRLFRS